MNKNSDSYVSSLRHMNPKQTRAKQRLLISGTALIALAIPALAISQPTATLAVKQTNRIEEIIVTSQRREQRLEEIPMAIIALSGDMLERSGIANMHDLGQVTPGLQVNWAGGFSQPSIRGVSTLTNGPEAENNIALYIDGFYEPSSVVFNMDLANLAGIEVLKGPQGTLYGRNATGGAILLNTLAPSETLTGKAEVTYGRFDDKRITGYISGPINDRIRYSVAGYKRDMEGYIELSDPERVGRGTGKFVPLEQEALRTKLEMDITESLTATLAYNYVYADDSRGMLFTPFDNVSPSVPEPPARAVKRDMTSYNSKTTRPVTQNQYTLKLQWILPFGSLTSYTGHSSTIAENFYDTDGTYAQNSRTINRFDEDTFQQALDLSINTIDNLELIVGAMYYENETDSHPGMAIQAFNGDTLLQRIDTGIASEAYALYADGTYHITDSLSLNLGGRYSYEEKEAYFQRITGTGSVVFPFTKKKDDFDQFTPRLSLRYQINDRVGAYAAYSQGFRSGTYSLSGAATPEMWNALDPELIDAYEIGVKVTGDRYRLDVATFYYDYQDLQVSTTQPHPSGVGNLTVFENADTAKVLGFDALLEVALTEKLSVRIGGAWLDAEYKRFPNATGLGLDISTGTNVSSQQQDWSGQRMARAPEFSGNIGADYFTPIAGGNGGSLLLSANLSYSDSYVVNNPSLYGPLAGSLANKQRYVQGSITLLNANATWTDRSERYSIGIFGTNLTNEKYLIQHTGTASGDRGNYQQPRSLGIRLGYQF